MGLSFNGINQGVVAPAISVCRNISAGTEMAWFRVNSFTASSGVVQVCIDTLGGASRFDIVLESDGILTLGGRAPDSAVRQIIQTTSPISLDTWYHVAGTIDFAADTAALYLNGVQVSTTGTMFYTPVATDNTNPAALNFGSNEDNTAEFLDGDLEDIRIYHRALSASEIATIYACRGSDSIVHSLAARYLPIGVEGAAASSDSGSISINNPQSTSSSTRDSSLSLSYTVPSGSDLVLVVVAGAESSTSGNVQASTATFASANMTKITSLQVGSSQYDGLAMFALAVSPGSGTIQVNWAGSSTNRSLHAFTLSGCNPVPDVYETASNAAGNTTDSITTNNNGSVVVSGGINGNPNTLSAVGTNHILQTAQTPNSSATAMGTIEVPTAGTITGIGWTSSSTNRMVQILAAFSPMAVGDEIIDLSDNENHAQTKNSPTYLGTFIRNRYGNG